MFCRTLLARFGEQVDRSEVRRGAPPLESGLLKGYCNACWSLPHAPSESCWGERPFGGTREGAVPPKAWKRGGGWHAQ